jgi:hypothetical protein
MARMRIISLPMSRAALNLVLFCVLSIRVFAVDSQNSYNLFARTNLMAWCIVPFDSQKRTPEARVEMLEKLGFKQKGEKGVSQLVCKLWPPSNEADYERLQCDNLID